MSAVFVVLDCKYRKRLRFCQVLEQKKRKNGTIFQKRLAQLKKNVFLQRFLARLTLYAKKRSRE
jgi:hypothetical protein